MTFIQLGAGALLIGIALGLFLRYAQSLFRREQSCIRQAVPYEPRTPVPWNGLEVFCFFAGWFLMTGISVVACHNLQFSSQLKERPLKPEQVRKLQKEHQITQLVVSGRGDPRVFLVVFFSGAIVVPFGEEFLFRLLLQGYLEKLEGVWRKFRQVSQGVCAVFCSAAVFAAIHWRSTTEERHVQNLFDVFLALMIGHLITLAVIVAYLLFFRGVTLRDLGIVPRKIFGDCVLGAGAAVFLLPPVWLLNIGLSLLIGDVGVALDPVPLFFFAAGLGVLYFRTHRILPCVVAHGIFNGIALVFVYAGAYTIF